MKNNYPREFSVKEISIYLNLPLHKVIHIEKEAMQKIREILEGSEILN